MNFGPQKFFIGLMDFFSIPQTGALLTWMLMGEVNGLTLAPGSAIPAMRWLLELQAGKKVGPENGLHYLLSD
jgi:hypothetical protein